jgi:hypothetical protein
MKRLFVLQVILLLIVLSGCKEDKLVTTDFSVSGLNQENKEDDDILQYFTKAYHLMDLITSHDKYPTNIMTKWNEKRIHYMQYGVSKENYSVPKESDLQKASNASRIITLINSIYFLNNDFVENEPFTYLEYTITTYANDDFIYYHQIDSDGYIKEFSILISDDNAKYMYYETSETQTIYQQNDFDKGNLYINIFELEDTIRYGYSFYNYQTDIEETIYYVESNFPTLEYYQSNYQNGELISYIINEERTIITVDLLDEGIQDLFLEEITYPDETTYEIGFSALNLEWDEYKDNRLYVNDNLILENRMVNVSHFNTGILISTHLLHFREELYDNKMEEYLGPFTFQDLDTLYTTAKEQTTQYGVQVNGETITITLGGTIYTPQELKTLFLSYIPTENN